MTIKPKYYMPVIEGELVKKHRLAAGMSLRAAAEAMSGATGQEISHKCYQYHFEKPGDHVIEPDELYALQKIFNGQIG